jgi:hypothetical protein
VARESFKGVAIEKLTAGQHLAVNAAEFGLLADRLPVLSNGSDLVFYQRSGFRFFQVKIWRGSK